MSNRYILLWLGLVVFFKALINSSKMPEKSITWILLTKNYLTESWNFEELKGNLRLKLKQCFEAFLLISIKNRNAKFSQQAENICPISVLKDDIHCQPFSCIWFINSCENIYLNLILIRKYRLLDIFRCFILFPSCKTCLLRKQTSYLSAYYRHLN